jgi:hypothetical protein
MTEPSASSTAFETMFSEAISSISCCWRPSSLAIESAISGSLSASEALKKPEAPAAVWVKDMRREVP